MSASSSKPAPVSEPKVLLVTGATGNQGGALIRSLVSEFTEEEPASQTTQPPFTILAVTRSPSSPSAQHLASLSPHIRLLKGDLTDIPQLFANARELVAPQPIWGVYSVQPSQGKDVTHEGEIEQGTQMVDEALKAGVRHFVYSSVDRGGEVRSWENETPIPHFASKHQIEQHIKQCCEEEQKQASSSMSWTILRPVAFMDNLEPGFPSRVFLAAMRDTLAGPGSTRTAIQWVAVKDIGDFAAMAFRDPAAWAGKAVGLAGDELGPADVERLAGEKTGKPATLRATWGFLGALLKWAVPEMGVMLDWFAEEGYGVDVKACRGVKKDMMDFETWLVKESRFDCL